MIEMFQLWYDNRHEYAKNWKERTGGKMVGFILGDASGWEYGVPDTVGWIDTIGVHPDYQKRGVARALLTEMIDNLKKVGWIPSTRLLTGETGASCSSSTPWDFSEGI